MLQKSRENDNEEVFTEHALSYNLFSSRVDSYTYIRIVHNFHNLDFCNVSSFRETPIALSLAPSADRANEL